MEIFDANVRPIFQTAISVATLFAVVFSGLRSISAGYKSVPSTFIAAFAFALLGFVTGSIMANSRESAVAAVLPAVLTLLGGLLAYLIGTKGYEKQTSVSGLVICFVAPLYVGTTYGSLLRYAFDRRVEDPEYQRARDLSIEANRDALELTRLGNYARLMKLQKELAKSEDVDLSGFRAFMSEKPTEKAGASRSSAASSSER